MDKYIKSEGRNFKVEFFEVMDEEQEAFDNLKEGLQQTENGEKMEANIELLDEVNDFLDDKIYELHDVVGEKILGW